MAPPFENAYNKKQTKTEHDCWLCRKSTTCCLTTDNYANGGDFLYACELHLKDRNFATALAQPTSTADSAQGDAGGPSQEEIDAAVKEYRERQKAKEDKKAGEKDKDSNGEKETLKKEGKSTGNSKVASPGGEAPPPPATQFQLHKSFFEMRLRQAQQKQHARDAQARGSQLAFPSAPNSRPAGSR